MRNIKRFYRKHFSYLVDRLKDFGTVVRPLWIVLLFQLLIFAAFVLAPQGQDMLLSMVINFDDHWFAFLWLLISLFALSTVSEFGSRLIIYFSDLTTHELEPRRVRYRKVYQRSLSKILLFAPVVFVAWGFIATSLRLMKGSSIDAFQQKNPFFILVIIVAAHLLLAFAIYQLYFGKLRKKIYVLALNRWQKFVLSKLYSISKIRLIPAVEVVEGKPQLVQVQVGGKYFFRPILRRFHTTFLLPAVLFIVIFSFLPVKYFPSFGAAAIVCLSLACWIAVYCWFDILDKVQPLFINIPYRLIMLIALLLFSWYNHDHPARIAAMKPKTENRKPVQQYFDDWVEAKGFDKDSSFPVVFVSAEGGALRTGCFTSMMLAQLQDSFPAFKNHVFCYSSVSGGSLGTNFFNALTQLPVLPSDYATVTRKFYEHDFLTATTGKLVFSELFNAYSPRMISRFDRATALEKSWEYAFADATATDADSNLFTQNFSTGAGNPAAKDHAALLINITEVESGLRAIFSNVLIDPVNFNEVADVQKKARVQLPYSTAISLSARFPLASPAGAIEWREGFQLHYVDGGYYENKGAQSAAEALQAIKQFSKYKNKAEFYVIQFHFIEPTPGEFYGLRFLNEPREIMKAMMNVQSGHTQFSYQELFRMCKQNNAVLIPLYLPLDGHKVPMNWVLSDAALTRLETVCKTLLKTDKNLQPLRVRLQQLSE